MSSDLPLYGTLDTRRRILTATWSLITEDGAAFKIRDVAQRSEISRQAVYLHFGDRSGLLVGLVQHMDDVLELGTSLAHAFEAPTSDELLRRVLRVNTEFWDKVASVAQVLEAAQHDDEAVADAWRGRMRLRRQIFTSVVQRISDNGELAVEWTVDGGAAMVYALAAFEPWRELTRDLRWDHDRYVEETTRLLVRALLADAA